RLRRAGKIVRGAGPLHWMYGAFVGYGYKPGRMLGVIAGVWLACAVAYWIASAPPRDMDPFLVPAKEDVSSAREDPGSFDPFFYSADVLLPIVDLGYGDAWRPVVSSRDPDTQKWGRRLRALRWVEIMLGWLFGGALAAMLTQLVKKD
ncbi:MAG TPA: hypothetical protein VE989_06765, partial [Sphingomicrobium sp.]|nr:hypothetical protein [Sphingomicrobium sp.]